MHYSRTVKAAYYHPANSFLYINKIKPSNNKDTKLYFVTDYLYFNILPNFLILK